MRFVEVRAQVAAVATDHHPRDRVEQSPLRHADAIAAQQVCAARPVFPGPPRSVIEYSGELLVHLVVIGRGHLVQDDDIRAQPLQPPVFLRLQDLAGQRHINVADDAHQQDGQVAGDAMRPQTRLAELVGRNRRRTRAERAVGEQQPRRETLEEERVVARHPQVAQAALCVGEGECERA